MDIKIILKGEGLSYEANTTLLKASQIIAFLSNDQDNLQVAERLQNFKNMSPRQAILEANAKTNVEKIVVLADYLCKQNNQSSVSPKEIRMAFKRAGERLPGNFNRDLKSADDLYLFEDPDKKGEYKLTDFSKEAIRNGFSVQNSKIKTKRPSSQKKANINRKRIVNEEVEDLQISPKLEGFPDYWNLKKKGERILWIVAFADKKGINGLTTSEIELLASRLRDKILANQFTSLTHKLFKESCLTKHGNKVKVLKHGLDYLNGRSNG